MRVDRAQLGEELEVLVVVPHTRQKADCVEKMDGIIALDEIVLDALNQAVLPLALPSLART